MLFGVYIVGSRCCLIAILHNRIAKVLGNKAIQNAIMYVTIVSRRNLSSNVTLLNASLRCIWVAAFKALIALITQSFNIEFWFLVLEICKDLSKHTDVISKLVPTHTGCNKKKTSKCCKFFYTRCKLKLQVQNLRRV